MDNKKNLRAAFLEITSEYTAYLLRFLDFRMEHKEYLQPLLEKAQKENWPRVDPQEIFNADAFVKEIEDAGLEDEIEDFDALKYKGFIYHQYRAFAAEGRYYDKTILELQISIFQEDLKKYERWLENPQKDVSEATTTPQSPEMVAELEKMIVSLKERISTLSLELAAKQPHLSN